MLSLRMPARPGPLPEPVLSVVMPLLNQAAFLRTAVDSVLGSTRQAVELVVMDGGSTDGSLELLGELGLRFPGRLRWWSRPDRGPADAVNAAIRAARAPLIGWLNADDAYETGAIDRALRHFRTRPADVLVYGEGQHIDARGRVLGPYPTRPADTPRAAFAQGCFICQPTAFFRRSAFEALGGLDTRLGAAFDFDLWLRFFAAHPGGIAHLPQLQASSRLHADTITMRMRERVALEGMQVIARHLGPAPAHWVLTHFDEIGARHPFDEARQPLRARLADFYARARALTDDAGRAQIEGRLAGDRPLAWAAADSHLPVHPDGSAGPRLAVRIAHAADPIVAFELQIRPVSRRQRTLPILVVHPDGPPESRLFQGGGPHTLRVRVPPLSPGQRTLITLLATEPVVPAALSAGSRDRRELGYRVETCRWLRASDPEAAADPAPARTA